MLVNTWVLIVYVIAGAWNDGGAAITYIPGFSAEGCQAAAARVMQDARSSEYGGNGRLHAVCVKQS